MASGPSLALQATTMTHPFVAKLVAGSLALAYASLLSGCWWGRREPRHDDRVVVHDDHHDEHHDEHHDDHRGDEHEK
jgi:hypothetical protein